MKKLGLLLLLPLLLLTSCNDGAKKDEYGNNIHLADNFSLICSHGYIDYLRDVDTDIMYVYYFASYRASLSVYYDAEGKPMTYTEFKEVHTAKYHG